MQLPTFYEAAWIFIIYAFLGWCTEVAFQAVCHGKFINRGFLNGAVCPIYGFGILFVCTLLDPLRDNLLLLFLGSVLLTSSLEYITGFALEKVFKDKWWDYSHEFCNIHGYICLRFSLIWGLACVFVIDLIHPMVLGLIHRFPENLGHILLAVLYATLFTDLVITVRATLKMKRRLELLDSLSQKLREASDGIGKPLASSAINLHNKLEETKEDAEQLREKIKALAEEKSFTQNRILKSYPRFSNGRYKYGLANLKQYLNSGIAPHHACSSAEISSALHQDARMIFYKNTFAIIVDTLEARDAYTAHHSRRVAEMAIRFCAVLNIPPMQAEAIELTAAIHDIGKIGISDSTLTKAGKLNDEEWAEMKKHPSIGSDILLKAEKLENAAKGVLHHHERWDGRGYPDGISGQAIPLSARIIAICDSTDAMLSRRIYREALSAEECKEELRKNAGKMYDPELTPRFLDSWDFIVDGLYKDEEPRSGS